MSGKCPDPSHPMWKEFCEWTGTDGTGLSHWIQWEAFKAGAIVGAEKALARYIEDQNTINAEKRER